MFQVESDADQLYRYQVHSLDNIQKTGPSILAVSVPMCISSFPNQEIIKDERKSMSVSQTTWHVEEFPLDHRNPLSHQILHSGNFPKLSCWGHSV